MDQQRIADRYELQSRIGTGGMSRVYLAQDRVLGRHVAVKLLDADSAADPSFVERFRREARAAASLNHPNIVSVYDWGAADPNARDVGTSCLYYMVMEHVPGGNLKDLLRKRGPLPEEDVLTLGAQIADALAEAHQHGIVHRDVKPHNVLLDARRQAKVADFGIAHAAGLTQLTVTNAVSGTAHYISPEQAQQHPVDGRSDLYSLGVVLYELLTGQEPFRGGSLVEVALKHVQEKPVPPRRLRPEISPATNSLILKALAKDPNQRHQTAVEMREAIEQALARLHVGVSDAESETLPGAATAVETTEVARWPVRRSPAVVPVARQDDTSRRWAWLMAVPVILLLAGIAGAVLHARTGNGVRTAAQPTATPPTRVQPTRVSKIVPPHAAPTATKSASTVSTAAPRSAPTPGPASSPTPPVIAGATSMAIAPTAPAPTAPAGSSNGAPGPGQAVGDFYQLAAEHRFGQAALLWTPHMLASYPPATNISQRFGATRDLSVQIDGVKQTDADHAVVSVTIQERYGTPPRARTLVGSWQVTRTSSGWLLDQPHF